MKTPIVSQNYYIEREGVLKLALELNKYGYIFRETSNGDIGIDGQIEYISDNGHPIGKIVAAQVKSGNSYLHDKGNHYGFYPHEKHKNYWTVFPLPVILFVYYPKDDKIYFTDVRYQLNSSRQSSYIKINKQDYLYEKTALSIFETSGKFNIPYYSIPQTFNLMLNTVSSNPTFNLSFLDLFTQGLTNMCRHIYFSMDLVMKIADYNNKTDFNYSIGSSEHDFLHDYIKFIISQNLAAINYSDYLIDWRERQLQPMFIAPINNRGFHLLNYISQVERKYKADLPKTTLVRERIIEMKFYSEDDNTRLELGQKLRERLKTEV
ncbi:hypothetical protein MHTCC0001_21890 [Flavobacteriaceae bacterium MHTCC 0001]